MFDCDANALCNGHLQVWWLVAKIAHPLIITNGHNKTSNDQRPNHEACGWWELDGQRFKGELVNDCGGRLPPLAFMEMPKQNTVLNGSDISKGAFFRSCGV